MTTPTSATRKTSASGTPAKAKALSPSPATIAVRAMRAAQKQAQLAREAGDLGKTGHSGRSNRLVSNRSRLRGRAV